MKPGKLISSGQPSRRTHVIAGVMTAAVVVFGIGTYRLYNSEAASQSQATAAHSTAPAVQLWLVLVLTAFLFVVGCVLGVRWVMSRRPENQL